MIAVVALPAAHFIGIGWELLYRGFLLLALAPWLGTWGAVVLAAVAYGAAQGYKSPGQLTGSLWWLMLLHVAMPLTAPLYYFKMMRDEAAVPSRLQLD